MPTRDDRHRIRCNRRNFLPLLLQEVLVTLDSAKGIKPGHSLNELADLPDDQLFMLKPVMNPRYRVFVRDGHVCVRHLENGEEYVLFPMEQHNLTVFNEFNGKLSLGDIRDKLVQDMAWDVERAAVHVRELFLSLATRLICFPQNPPDEQA